MVYASFEIGVLDEVGRNLGSPPLRLPFGVRLQPVATEGLTGSQRFFEEPIPSEATYAVGSVSERDVQFAKAMVLHHEGAVEMARGYHANADARNGYLGLMNVDIVTDQTQEIALMRRVIAAYPGDASRVQVDPSMVHGMEGMKHGGHAGHGAPAAPAGTAEHAGAAEHARYGAHGGSEGAAEPRQAPPRPGPVRRSRQAAQPSAAPAEQVQQHDNHH